MNPIKRAIRTAPYQFGDKIKAVWCWQVEWANQADYVVKFCVDHHINLFLIPYNATVPISQWRYFISELWKHRIPVHALHGDRLWGMPGYVNDGLAKIDAVNGYNAQVGPNERFKGMHYDVEPYSLDEWGTDRMGVIRSWVANMQVYADRTRSYGMPFAGAFPYWLDTSKDVIDATPPEYTKPVYEIMVDMCDEFAVMSYRDTAAGMIDAAQGEVDYADHPKVVVSAELTQQTPASITFFEEGVLAMENALKEAHDHFRYNPGYAGIAIHDFEEYELMRKKYARKPTKRKLAAK